MARRERETTLGEVTQRRRRPRMTKIFALPDGPAEPVYPNPRNLGRNNPCPCGSGKKFKHCHLGKPIVVKDSATREN